MPGRQAILHQKEFLKIKNSQIISSSDRHVHSQLPFFVERHYHRYLGHRPMNHRPKRLVLNERVGQRATRQLFSARLQIHDIPCHPIEIEFFPHPIRWNKYGIPRRDQL